MSEIDRDHLAPLFALVLLTFLVLMTLFYRRVKGLKRGDFPKGYFKLLKNDSGKALPEKMEQAARNWINLFEVPVLFYLYTLLLLWTQKDDQVTLLGSWIFVATRYMHSWVHLYSNKVRFRFFSYGVGTLLLYALWARLAYQIFC